MNPVDRIVQWTERLFPNQQPISMVMAKQTLRHIFPNPPRLILSPIDGAATATSGTIRLPVWALNLPVLLHEAAHVLEYSDGHGPHFMRRLIDLYACHAGIDRVMAEEIALELCICVAIP